MRQLLPGKQLQYPSYVFTKNQKPTPAHQIESFSKKLINGFLLGLLIIIGTFPENNWSFSTGIDPPLFWVFNSLFRNGLELGKHIIFPHGPLAFFMYPLQYNVVLSTLATSSLKLLLLVNFFQLVSYKQYKFRWPIAFLASYVFAALADFNQLICVNLILLYCNYFLSRSSLSKLIAFFLTGFSFYVKANVAIISGVLFAAFSLYQLVRTRNLKAILGDSLAVCGFILAFWLVMYGTFDGFVNHIEGVINLVQDNSSAASYYPHNNWWILSLFFLSLILLAVLNKTEEAFFFWLLVPLSLFAVWKHAMAREDVFHVRELSIYTFFCLTIFVLFHKKNLVLNIALSFAALYFFSVNMQNSSHYFPANYSFFKAGNFVDFVTNFSDLQEKAASKSTAEIARHKLPAAIRHAIAESTVDVYPYDYSIIAANKLNWQPRVVLHSYAAYTSWLDRKNADHFAGPQSPEFLIIERTDWFNINGGDYSSIDNRYFLNDEPQTILELIRHYDFFASEGRYLILKKRNTPVHTEKRTSKPINLTWSAWTPVPESQNRLLRAKLVFDKSLMESVKSFFFKDEQFWVYLQLQNGLIHKYKIVPKNAADGIWINPYIFSSSTAYSVKNIAFKCSNQAILSNDINVVWEEFSFSNQLNRLASFFHTNPVQSDSIINNSTDNFEHAVIKNWRNINQSQLSGDSYKGARAYTIKAKSASPVFSLSMDSLAFQPLKIAVDCWVKAPSYRSTHEIFLVLEIRDKEGAVNRQEIAIDDQLIDENQWNNIAKNLSYQHNEPNCRLNAYIANRSGVDLLVDDFRVTFIKTSARPDL